MNNSLLIALLAEAVERQNLFIKSIKIDSSGKEFFITIHAESNEE